MYAFADYRITDEEIQNLLKLNIEVIKVPKCTQVYEAINGHPDIQLNILKNNSATQLIVQKDISQSFYCSYSLSKPKDKQIPFQSDWLDSSYFPSGR